MEVRRDVFALQCRTVQDHEAARITVRPWREHHVVDDGAVLFGLQYAHAGGY